VADGKGVLRGRLTLVEVLKAAPDQPVETIMEEAAAVRVDTDQEEVAQVISRYDLLAVPVVDLHGRIVGIVTVDDVVDILTEEATEDAQLQGAMQPLENPYFLTGFWEMTRKRGLWLLVLFLGELFTGNALRHFQGVLEHTLNLVFFIPLIMSSGGNSGSQSASLITRSLAVGEVRVRDIMRVAGREVGTGLALGVVLGGVGYLRAMLWRSSVHVCLTVAFTLVGVVAAGSVVGAVLPIFFKRIGLDPAITSSPFIASLVDVTGIFIYLTVAKMVLGL
jgi:magnesium transporter